MDTVTNWLKRIKTASETPFPSPTPSAAPRKPTAAQVDAHTHAAKTVLFTSKIGAGTGHVLPCLPMLQYYQRAGYRVVAALRDVRHSSAALRALGIAVVQCPSHPQVLLGIAGKHPHALAAPKPRNPAHSHGSQACRAKSGAGYSLASQRSGGRLGGRVSRGDE